MSVKRRIKCPAINGLAAGQTATFDLPVGPRYHELWFSGDNKAAKVFTDSINECRLKVNGKVQRVFTASELDVLNKLNGAQYGIQGNAAGGLFYLPIFFAEPWRKSVSSMDGLAWGTGDLSSFQLEVDIKAVDNPDALGLYAIVDNSLVVDGKGNSSQQPMGGVTKWFRTLVPVTGTALDFDKFPKRDFYQQISFFDSNISKVTVKVDNNVIHELTKGEMDAVLTAHGMTPVSTRYDLVFDHDDLLNSALPMAYNGSKVQDFQIHLDLADGTARNIPAIYQVFGPAE